MDSDFKETLKIYERFGDATVLDKLFDITLNKKLATIIRFVIIPRNNVDPQSISIETVLFENTDLSNVIVVLTDTGTLVFDNNLELSYMKLYVLEILRLSGKLILKLNDRPPKAQVVFDLRKVTYRVKLNFAKDVIVSNSKINYLNSTTKNIWDNDQFNSMLCREYKRLKCILLSDTLSPVCIELLVKTSNPKRIENLIAMGLIFISGGIFYETPGSEMPCIKFMCRNIIGTNLREIIDGIDIIRSSITTQTYVRRTTVGRYEIWPQNSIYMVLIEGIVK